MKKTYRCPKCGSVVTKLPITNYKEKGKIIHIPYFGKAKCDKCGWEGRSFKK